MVADGRVVSGGGEHDLGVGGRRGGGGRGRRGGGQ